MPQSLAQIYLHLIFSTENRVSWFSSEQRTAVHRYIAKVAHTLGAPALEVGGVSDHIHILLRMPCTQSISDVVSVLKSRSSRWYKEDSPTRDRAGFAWQKGFGCFSVSPGHMDALRGYIANQEVHHRTESFQDEFRRLLTIYGLEYDERYVWG